jgi:hypothetical protein
MKTNELKDELQHNPDFRDAVKRIKYAMDIHAVAGSYGWAAFKLEDGSTDNVAYESWKAAVKSTKWDRDNYMYLEIQPDGMHSELEAAAVFDYARTLHKGGYRIPSPDWEAGALASSMPNQPWDKKTMAKQLISGKPLDPNGYTNLNHLPSERLINKNG